MTVGNAAPSASLGWRCRVTEHAQEQTAAIGRFVIFPLTCTGVGEGCLEVASAALG
jgi:hypothetical protein